MGLNLNYILYLQRNGHLTAENNRVLDLGPQNVFHATVEQIHEVIRNQGRSPPSPALIDKLVTRSIPGNGFEPTYFFEIATLAGIDYHAFDVCPGPETEIVDLNLEGTPSAHVGRYDVVLNFGTTEHIINQINSFKVLHEATRVGGVIYCQLPATGYFEHGYFCYTPLFFRDLAANNDYENVDTFLTMAGRSNLKELGIEIRHESDPRNPRQIGDGDTSIAYFNMHVVLRRRSDAPFRIGLEVSTGLSTIDRSLLVRYAEPQMLQLIDRMERSFSWRLTAPLRAAVRFAKSANRRARFSFWKGLAGRN